MSTPTTNPPRLEKADRQRWAAVRLAKRASELARACDFKRAFRFHRAAARCTELSLRGFAA